MAGPVKDRQVSCGLSGDYGLVRQGRSRGKPRIIRVRRFYAEEKNQFDDRTFVTVHVSITVYSAFFTQSRAVYYI